MNRNFYIVVADDDLDDQYLIKQAVAETGIAHQIIFLSNGLQLMELLLKKGSYADTNDEHPDLILLDLNMPLLDGYGALAQIRINFSPKELPVYVLSTSRFEYDKNKSKELGANDFFTKPDRLPALKDIIKNICFQTLEGVERLKK